MGLLGSRLTRVPSTNEVPIMNLHGTTVVVTGGSSGIGLATAKLVKEQGATVTIASRSSDRLQHAARELGDVRAVIADITSEAGVHEIFGELDRVDHVFIAGGQLLLGKILDADLETLRSDVDQRLWGPLYVVRTAGSAPAVAKVFAPAWRTASTG
jgi:NADP-dependent 3-hydroxy acid dehydrogenase YdfG